MTVPFTAQQGVVSSCGQWISSQQFFNALQGTSVIVNAVRDRKIINTGLIQGAIAELQREPHCLRFKDPQQAVSLCREVLQHHQSIARTVPQQDQQQQQSPLQHFWDIITFKACTVINAPAVPPHRVRYVPRRTNSLLEFVRQPSQRSGGRSIF